jgi:hypothetical protein
MVWHAFEKMKHPLGQAICLSKHPTSFFFPIIPALCMMEKNFKTEIPLVLSAA